MRDNKTPSERLHDLLDREDGHAYAYGGGSLLLIILIVILLIWLL